MYDWPIDTDSAAIDEAPSAGITVDIDLEQRPEGSAPTPFDIGADEFVAAKYKVFLPLVVNTK